MSYVYRIDKINRIILVTVVGELNAINFKKLCLDVYKMALKLKSKIVFDLTEANITICIGTAYFWFQKHMDKVDVHFRTIPSFYIANDNNWSFLEFIEIAWTNRGICIKVFKQKELAIKWLSSLRFKTNDTESSPRFQDFIVEY